MQNGRKRHKKRRLGIPAQIGGMAGVYHVASELSRRGYIALPTNRNVRSLDIIVSDQTGLKYAVLQVKTLQTKQKYWPCNPVPNHMRKSKNCFYIFVRFDKGQNRYECFIATAEEVAKKMGGYAGPWCGWNLPEGEDKNYLNKWDKLKLD